MPKRPHRPPSLSVRVVNVVASTRLSRPVRLEQVSVAIPELSYEPERFPGIIYRRTEPKATIILFANGKFVSTGTTSEEMAKEALRVTLREVIRAEGQSATMRPIETVNLVVVADLGRELDLARVLPGFPDATYEPEAFPGLVVWNEDHSVVLLFGSGKLVCSGSRSERIARTHVREIQRRLVAGGYL